MPNWKKLIVSGSDASLNSLNVTNNVTAQSFTGSFSGSFTAPGATTQVVYNNGGTLSADSGFVYSGSRVGIGTATPVAALHIIGSEFVNIVQSTSSVSYTQYYNTSTGTGGTSDGFTVGNNGTDAYVFNRETSNLILGTSNTEAMRITSTGNVGIGTTSPGTNLDVIGNIRASNYLFGSVSTITPMVLNIAAGDLVLENATVGYNLLLKTNGAEQMRITNLGSVGIGTFSPAAKLEVVGNVLATSFTGSFSGSVSAPGSTTQIVYNDNGVLAASSGLVYSGSNVGIGISAPTDKLHIVSSATGNQFGRITATDSNSSAAWVAQNDSGDNVVYRVFSSGVSGTQMGSALGRSASLLANLGGSGVFLLGTFSNTNFVLGTNNTERMRITNGGNVGIGTTTPGAKLDIVSTGAGSEGLRVDGANGGFAFVVKAGSDYTSHIRAGATVGVNYFTTPPSNGLIVEGNVGIGTTSAFRKLVVDNSNSGGTGGYVRVQNEVGGAGANVGVDFATFSPQYYSASLISLDPTAQIQATDISNFSGRLDVKVRTEGTSGTLATVASFARNGNVGIGTTTPTYNLHVSSSGYYGGNLTVEGTITAQKLNVQQITSSVVYSSGSNIFGNSLANTQTFTGSIQATGSTHYFLGDVGIGTTGPGAPLDVYGSLNSSKSIIRVTNSDTVNYITLGAGIPGVSNAGMNFTLDGSSKMVISAGGNIGIGTTSPYAGTNVTSLDINATAYPVLALSIGSSYVGGMTGFSNHVAVSAKSGNYITLEPNDTEAVRITSAGNVGIGTTSPGNKLHIVGAANGTDAGNIRIDSTDQFGGLVINENTTFRTFLGYGNAGNIFSNAQSDSTALRAANYLHLGASSVATITINASDNVGIGTTSPGYKLEVVGAVSASTYYGDGSNLTNIGSGSISAAGSDGQLQYNNSGLFGGASRLYYNDSTNRVGIGTSSPGYDLDVSGSVRVQDRLRVGVVNTGNGVIHQSSDATINPSGATIVWSVPGSAGICAFIEYYVFNSNTGTSQRAGNIVTTWNAGGSPQITHTETTTPDVGSTTAITFTTTLTLGGDPQLVATNTSGDTWYMVMNYRYF